MALTLASLGLLRTGVHLSAQVGEYPAPRYPRYLVKPSAERLLQAARIAVRQPYGMSPLGKMQSGQKVHVFVEYTQDMQVWEAVRAAWAERGITAMLVPNWELMGMTKDAFEAQAKKSMIFGWEGWKEWGAFEPKYLAFLPTEVQKEWGPPLTLFTQYERLGPYLDKHPDVELFYIGPGGGKLFVERAVGKKHADKFVGNWIYENPIDLVSKASTFPGDVWSLVDDRIVKPIPHVTEGMLTDPEGTRLHWTLTPEQTRRWTQGAGNSNHLNIYPPVAHATWREGVIRAAANHTGFFPPMTVHLNENGRVVRVEGGGKNGDLFRMVLDHPKMKNAKFPTAREGGYWYLTQDGFATNPKFVRNMIPLTKGSIEFNNLSERQRAGVQHFSFSQPAGINFGDNVDPRDIEYAKQAGLPLEHTAHMHVYFATIKWKLGDTGEWITLSDRGQVKAFDDPEIRALASKYGDPDQLFRYEWIPEIPGVNTPGDYARDYSADPWKWIMSEWGRIQSGKYPHYVEDYSPGPGRSSQP
jgi:hypothetical protein